MAGTWSKMIHGKRCVSTVALQDVFGCTRQNIHRMFVDGMPREDENWWSLTDVIAWREQRGTYAGRTPDTDEELSVREAKLKAEKEFREIKVEQEKVILANLQKDYVPISTVESELSRQFIVLKKSLLSLGRVVSAEVAPYVDVVEARRIERQVSDIVTDGLNQIAVDGIYNKATGVTKRRKEAAN